MEIDIDNVHVNGCTVCDLSVVWTFESAQTMIQCVCECVTKKRCDGSRKIQANGERLDAVDSLLSYPLMNNHNSLLVYIHRGH